jgi:hypothetical protein
LDGCEIFGAPERLSLAQTGTLANDNTEIAVTHPRVSRICHQGLLNFMKLGDGLSSGYILHSPIQRLNKTIGK